MLWTNSSKGDEVEQASRLYYQWKISDTKTIPFETALFISRQVSNSTIYKNNKCYQFTERSPLSRVANNYLSQI